MNQQWIVHFLHQLVLITKFFTSIYFWIMKFSSVFSYSSFNLEITIIFFVDIEKLNFTKLFHYSAMITFFFFAFFYLFLYPINEFSYVCISRTIYSKSSWCFLIPELFRCRVLCFTFLRWNVFLIFVIIVFQIFSPILSSCSIVI